MNTISIYLKPSGSVAELKKDFAVFTGSYLNSLVDVYVPKSVLYQNQSGTFNFTNAVEIGALLTAPNGEQITSQSFFMNYLKDTSIFDPITNQNVEYSVYETYLPKEFTPYPGNQQLVVNVLSVDNLNAKFLQIITSQTCELQVQNSAYIDGSTVISPSQLEIIFSRITENQTQINYILNNFSTGEDYIGRLTGSTLPTSSELDNFVESVVSREPKTGDVVIYVQVIDGETDKNYKYIFTTNGWENYEIPPIEQANNGTLGLVEGTYNLGSTTNNTLVDIQNGQIVNIYILNTSNNYVNIRDVLNTNSTDIQNIFNDYASKLYVQGYSQPKEFNNVYYIDSNGYGNTVPTEPASGVQFTKQVNAVGDFEVFSISTDLTPGISFTQKNTYKSNIYVGSSVDISAIFRLTTEIVRDGGNIVLETTLTDLKQLIAGNVYNLAFDSVMSGLELESVNVQPNDKIQQTLDIITQESTSATISVYSNDIYPSFLQFNTQSIEIVTASGNLGEEPVFEATGVLNGNVMTFTLPNNTNLHNKTECLFKLKYNSLNITDDIEVVLSLNGQNIRLATPYNMMSGNATMGDLMQVPFEQEGDIDVFVTLRIKGFVEIDNNSNITVFVDEDDLYEYLKTDELPSKISNPNLLLNGDFSINTQGKLNYDGVSGTIVETVNNWFTNVNGSVVVTDNGIQYTTSGIGVLEQSLDKYYAGKTVTLSAKINGVLYSATGQIPMSKPEIESSEQVICQFSKTGMGYVKFVYYKSTGKLRVYTYFSADQTLFIEYIKLEIGSIATAYSPNVVENYLFTNLPSNPNLLINGDFRVNQRGKTSYTSMTEYTVDRWKNSGTNIVVNDDGTVTVNKISGWNFFYQIIEDYQALRGKTVTLTVKFKDISYTNGTPRIMVRDNVNAYGREVIKGAGIYSVTGTIDANATYVHVRVLYNGQAGDSDINATIEWAKLEIGSIATPFSPRPYAEELAMCQRYYEKIDTSLTDNKYQIRKYARSTYFFYDGKVSFKVRKRTIPTVKVYSSNTDTAGYLYDTNQTSDKAMSISYTTTDDFMVSITNGDVAVNDSCNGYFEADAEIY